MLCRCGLQLAINLDWITTIIDLVHVTRIASIKSSVKMRSDLIHSNATLRDDFDCNLSFECARKVIQYFNGHARALANTSEADYAAVACTYSALHYRRPFATVYIHLSIWWNETMIDISLLPAQSETRPPIAISPAVHLAAGSTIYSVTM